MPTLRKVYEQLKADVASLRLRIDRDDTIDSEPSVALGQRVFLPDTNSTFLLDRLASGAAGTSSQYVLRDGITHEIPITLPPPGIFEARFLRVSITQRLFHPTEGVQQIVVPPCPAMSYADAGVTGAGGVQTVKWAYAPNRFVHFFWNLVEGKSGRTLSDELIPDMALLPPLSQSLALRNESIDFPSETGDDRDDAGDVGLELDVPWPFERDADVKFLFRPITPIIQPAADSGFSPYGFDDREANGTVRNSAVTVQVELHGSRIYTPIDEQRAGARVDAQQKGGWG